MQSYTDITATNPQSDVFNIGAAVFPAATGTVYQTVWCATARPAEESGGTRGSAIDKMVRTNTNCFMRGLKERIEIKTNSPLSWQWRRICFTIKGDTINFGNADPTQSEVMRQTSAGMTRLQTIDDGTISRVTDLVFKGTNGADWTNHFIAPIDKQRVTVYSDKTRIIRSGNSQGVIKMYKEWYPMNKMLIYDDEEAGDQMNPAPFSVEGKAGMGDFYVYDILYPNGGASGEELAMDIESRLYWHEK